MDPVISVRGLRKLYGEVVAVDGVDLEVARGEVFALLGPNGAGKTTTIEILEGYRRRTAGDVLVLGEDPEHGGAAWKSRIGIVLQTTSAFEELTVEEVVAHFARFYPDPLDPREVVGMVGLAEKRTSRCASLSGGQKRRVDVALGIVGRPELIFLDEPTTGFDPVARRQAWELVERLTDLGATIVLTTHYLDEAEYLADRAGIIIGGEIVEVASPREIGGRSTAAARVTFKAEGPLAVLALPRLPASDVAQVDGGLVTIHTETPTGVVAALAGWAAGAGMEEVPELTVTRPSLEDVYIRMIAAHAAATGTEVAV